MTTERDLTASIDEPHDRLTALAEEMLNVLKARPDTEDVKGIVMLTEGGWAGVGYHGFETPAEAMAGTVERVRAMMLAAGIDFKVMIDGQVV
jgi:hypothetical protein